MFLWFGGISFGYDGAHFIVNGSFSALLKSKKWMECNQVPSPKPIVPQNISDWKGKYLAILKKILIKPLYKKGDTRKCGNYQGIS